MLDTGMPNHPCRWDKVFLCMTMCLRSGQNRVPSSNSSPTAALTWWIWGITAVYGGTVSCCNRFHLRMLSAVMGWIHQQHLLPQLHPDEALELAADHSGSLTKSMLLPGKYEVSEFASVSFISKLRQRFHHNLLLS